MFFILAPMPVVWAVTDIPTAYYIAARQHQVPVKILYAIALTESGKPYKTTIRPWPWALNIAGEGMYCLSRQTCIDQSNKAIQQGLSVDISLMQVSWYWHHHRFASLLDAWEPEINLNIGAEIVREQYEKTNDWWLAVGRYHSPSNTERARVYRARVKKYWETL